LPKGIARRAPQRKETGARLDRQLHAMATHEVHQHPELSPGLSAYENRVKAKGSMHGRVALIDLTEERVDVISKFAQYRFFPTATYSVMVSTLRGCVKISIGFNPWCGQPLDINIGALCAQHGGGGHAVVGAISLAVGKQREALDLATSLTEGLQQPDPESNRS
jgi:hypothetical protein